MRVLQFKINYVLCVDCNTIHTYIHTYLPGTIRLCLKLFYTVQHSLENTTIYIQCRETLTLSRCTVVAVKEINAFAIEKEKSPRVCVVSTFSSIGIASSLTDCPFEWLSREFSECSPNVRYFGVPIWQAANSPRVVSSPFYPMATGALFSFVQKVSKGLAASNLHLLSQWVKNTTKHTYTTNCAVQEKWAVTRTRAVRHVNSYFDGQSKPFLVINGQSKFRVRQADASW